jgi:predicted SnoaL-like aldol condensation-catalyzing enzyme
MSTASKGNNQIIKGRRNKRKRLVSQHKSHHEFIEGRKEQGINPGSLRHSVQQRDYTAAERFWSPNYIQHSAHIEPGRDGLFNLIKSIPPTLRYEPGVIIAEGDFVIIHGRFSGFGLPVNWIAADIIRMKDGILLEHWDVIQDEAAKEQSKSGNPMFGDSFPDRA